MATLYLKAAGGNFNAANWSTTGAAGVDSNTPTAADNCIVELASGALTINSGSVCRSLDFTSGTGSYTGTVTHTAAVTLTIGDGTAGAGSVALKLASGMTYTLGNNTSSAITFASTSGTAQTVTTAGKTMGNQTFSGAGGSWQIADSLTMTPANLTHSAGTLDLNGQTISCLAYITSGAGTKVLTPGAAAVTITRTNSSPLDASGTNFSVSSNTSTWTFSAITSGTVNLGGFDWNGASFLITSAAQTAPTVVSNSATIKDFTWTGPATKTASMNLTGDLTCTGTFTFNGNSATNRTFLQSTTQGTVVTITAATTSLSYTDFQDITGAGAAAWTGTSMGNALDNSGITFDSPTTQTNTGATGSWSDATKWTSRVPLPQDTVVVNTGSGTITVDMPRLGADISLVGFTGTANFSLSTGMTVYGSFTLTSGATITISQAMTFGGRSTHTLTSAGKSFGANVTFQGIGGSYTLQDAYTETAGTLTVLAGTFDTGNFSVTTIGFTSSGALTRTVTLGTSTVSLTGTGSGTYWNISGPTPLTMNATASTIAIVNTSANTRTFTGSTFNYGTLTYTVAGSTGILTLTGQYFDTINFSDATNARTLQIISGTVVAVKNFNVQGTSGKLMTVKGVTGGSPAYLDLIGNYDTVDYLSVQDITSVIPYKFYAGANSTDVSGNTNLTIAAAPSSGQYINFVAEVGASGSSATVTFPYGLSPTSGQIIHLSRSFSSAAGTVNAITGYTATGIGNVYYKVSDGTETSITSTVTGSPSTHNLKVAIIGGFTGTPTYDVGDTNSGAGVTSLNTTASTGPTNTDATAIVIANFQGSGSLGASVSATNSYLWQRYGTETSTYRMLFNRVTSSAANSTTYTWTTSRNPSSTLVVYKDVAGGTTTSTSSSTSTSSTSSSTSTSISTSSTSTSISTSSTSTSVSTSTSSTSTSISTSSTSTSKSTSTSSTSTSQSTSTSSTSTSLSTSTSSTSTSMSTSTSLSTSSTSTSTTQSFTTSTSSTSSSTSTSSTSSSTSTSSTSSSTSMSTSTSSTSKSTSTSSTSTSTTTLPIATLSDNFNDNSTNVSLWSSTGNIVEQNQEVEVPTTGGGSGAYNSQNLYSIVGSELYVQYVQWAGDGFDYVLYFGNSAITNFTAWYMSGTTIKAYTYDGSFHQQGTALTLNSSVHKWFKLRESGGTYFFEWSTDGLSWTTHASVATSSLTFDPYQGKVSFSGNTHTLGTSIWDNLNVAASATTTSTSMSTSTSSTSSSTSTSSTSSSTSTSKSTSTSSTSVSTSTSLSTSTSSTSTSTSLSTSTSSTSTSMSTSSTSTSTTQSFTTSTSSTSTSVSTSSTSSSTSVSTSSTSSSTSKSTSTSSTSASTSMSTSTSSTSTSSTSTSMSTSISTSSTSSSTSKSTSTSSTSTSKSTSTSFSTSTSTSTSSTSVSTSSTSSSTSSTSSSTSTSTTLPPDFRVVPRMRAPLEVPRIRHRIRTG